MSAAWDVGDFYLERMLQAFLDLYAFDSFTVCLYKNDPTIVPGMVLADFEEADFPGYAGVTQANSGFSPVTVTTHVASATQSSPAVFSGSTGTWTPQTIYGYFLIDWNSEYYMSEKFSVPVDLSPDGELKVTPRLKHQTVPA